MGRIAAFFCIFLLMPQGAFAADDGSKFTKFLGFTLETVTLGDVASGLGKAEPQWVGTENNDVVSICYTNDSAVIRFSSLGDMGGANDRQGLAHELEGFTLSDKTEKDAEHCPPLPDHYAVKSASIGKLHLGMSRKDFEHAVGLPVEWKGATARRYYYGTHDMNKHERENFHLQKGQQDYFDVVITVEARFVDDRMSECSVWKVSSY